MRCSANRSARCALRSSSACSWQNCLGLPNLVVWTPSLLEQLRLLLLLACELLLACGRWGGRKGLRARCAACLQTERLRPEIGAGSLGAAASRPDHVCIDWKEGLAHSPPFAQMLREGADAAGSSTPAQPGRGNGVRTERAAFFCASCLGPLLKLAKTVALC